MSTAPKEKSRIVLVHYFDPEDANSGERSGAIVLHSQFVITDSRCQMGAVVMV
jgi:hypothetical protein